MEKLTIRLETEKDYKAVEELTREAFWNVYKPGADEHYFVHKMRDDKTAHFNRFSRFGHINISNEHRYARLKRARFWTVLP